MNQNNIILGVVAVVGALFTGAFVAFPLVVDKVSDSVIEKLEREYAPGPYAPGFDPDRVDPNRYRKQVNYPQQTSFQEEAVVDHSLTSELPNRFDVDQWRSDWEDQRSRSN